MSSYRPRSISTAVLPLIYLHSRRGQRIPGIGAAVLSMNRLISSERVLNCIIFGICTENGKFSTRVRGNEIFDFFRIFHEKRIIFSSRVRGSDILDYFEFVLKNRKCLPPGSEVVK